MASETVSKYTPAIIEKLQAVEGLNWAKAQNFAEENDLKPMGVVMCAKRNKIPYQAKERVTKVGEPVTTKVELVAQIAIKFSKDVALLKGLAKSNKEALEYLVS